MARWERAAGRTISAAGLVAGAAYLTWRLLASVRGGPWWLTALSAVVELSAFLSGAVTVWALWDAPAGDHDRAAPTAAAGESPSVTVVIRSVGRDLAQVEASVLAAHAIDGRGMEVVVVDLSDRRGDRAGGVEEDREGDREGLEDLNGLALIAATATTEWVLLLDAGDIADPSILQRLWAHVSDPSTADVAIVQAVGVSASPISVEHGAAGRHRLDLQRRVLTPSLSTRGTAIFTGSGALVRTAALREVEPGRASAPMAQMAVTTQLFAAGWRIVAPVARPLVAIAPVMLAAELEEVQACEASAARHGLLGTGGAWRIGALTATQRLALTAWAARPLAGLRRSALVALVAAVLLSGDLPFHASGAAIALTWLPWMACSSLGVVLLSGGATRIGDRTRDAHGTIGSSWRGMIAIDGRPHPPSRVLAGAFGLHHGVAPTAAAALVAIVLALRGSSDRWSHTLQPIAPVAIVGVLAVALWTLGTSLDSLRLLVSRSSLRRAHRLVTALPCSLRPSGVGSSDAPDLGEVVGLVDLTPHGAGVLGTVDLPVGTEVHVELTLPVGDSTIGLALPAVVRNVRSVHAPVEEHRLGLQFIEVPAAMMAVLAEWCLVRPALAVLQSGRIATAPGVPPRDLGADPRVDRSADPTRYLADEPEHDGPRRLAMRSVALLAAAGAMASISPAGAAGPVTIGGRVGVAGAVIRIACSDDSGPDQRFGTSDDRWLAPRSVVSASDGSYTATVLGSACWSVVALPDGWLTRSTDGGLAHQSAVGVVALPEGRGIDLRPTAERRTSDTDADLASPSGGAEHRVVRGRVAFDSDLDGIAARGEPSVTDVTVTAYGDDGRVVGRTSTSSADGTFSLTLPVGQPVRLAVSELPGGLVTDDPSGLSQELVVGRSTSPEVLAGLATVVVHDPATIDPHPATVGFADEKAPPRSTRWYPAPQRGELSTPAADPGSRGATSTTWATIVVVLAALLGTAVVIGTLLPAAARRGSGGGQGSATAQSVSPDFAIR